MGKICRHWVTVVGTYFGLSDYLFGPTANNNLIDLNQIENIVLPESFGMQVCYYILLSITLRYLYDRLNIRSPLQTSYFIFDNERPYLISIQDTIYFIYCKFPSNFSKNI
jgi:hypothetical protein